MLKDKHEILQAIVNDMGDCDLFASPAVCKRCPLGNKQVNGRKVSCMDYLKIDNANMEYDQVCDIYEKAAEEELFAMSLEEHLSEE